MKSKFFLYCGPGVGQGLISQMARMLCSFGTLEWIEPKDVRRGSWQKTASHFVMPGGADLPYCAELNGKGNERISCFVKQGGFYLGICAGSYYAANNVEFAKGTPLEVTGPRELAFFSGTVVGPTFWPFSYDGEGAKHVLLKTPFSSEDIHCFYHGGGHFFQAERLSGVYVLARYAEAPAQPAAIVHCKVGLGAALLSGVHFEVNFDRSMLAARLFAEFDRD